MNRKIKIGTTELSGPVVLAPMAGAGDRAFRETCAAFGAAYTVSEMVSAKALHFSDKKSLELMELGSTARPGGIQIFGAEPGDMAEAAKRALVFCPDSIDINMGCPAPKITCSGAGSALMKNPPLCGEIVSAVTNAVSIPVTVKIRAGWDSASINAVRVAQLCEQAGAAAVTVHGRTRAAMYAPPADLEIIRNVKQALHIPVIGNGDVTDGPSAARMLAQTGCDAVMIGRGALGNPWIFREIAAYLSRGEILPEPDVSERLNVMLGQVRLMVRYKGERRAMNEARKHVAWYLKGMRGAAGFRRQAGTLESMEQLETLIQEIRSAQTAGPSPSEQ